MKSYDETSCTKCKYCKVSTSRIHNHGCYCNKSGLNLSDSLERLDVCVKNNWKLESTQG